MVVEVLVWVTAAANVAMWTVLVGMAGHGGWFLWACYHLTLVVSLVLLFCIYRRTEDEV